jgi:hypothetical protein
MTPEPLHLRPFVVEHFVKACSDPDSLTTLNAYKQLYFQRNGSKAKAQKSGGWKRSNEKTLANILLLGVIISSDVGSYGSSVNAKTLDVRRFILHFVVCYLIMAHSGQGCCSWQAPFPHWHDPTGYRENQRCLPYASPQPTKHAKCA